MRSRLVQWIFAGLALISVQAAFSVESGTTVVSSAAAAENSDAVARQKAIRGALAAVRIPEGAKLIEKMIAEKAAGDPRIKTMTKAQRRDFDTLLKIFFSASSFEQNVLGAVTETSNDIPISAFLEFTQRMDGHLVRRMQTYELAALDNKKRMAMEAYEKKLDTKLPATSRLQLAGRYVRATGNADQSIRMNELMVRRMLQAGNPGMSASDLDERMANLRPKLVETSTGKVLISTLVQFREVDDQTFEKYIEILEQPEVSPLLQQIGDAAVDQMNLMFGRMLQSTGLLASGVPIQELQQQLNGDLK